jgi:hypothetical protein
MMMMRNSWLESKSVPYACKQVLVQAKALSVYENLSKDDDDDDEEVQPFSARTGWFTKSTKRYNFHNIKMRGDNASANTVAAEKFFTAL